MIKRMRAFKELLGEMSRYYSRENNTSHVQIRTGLKWERELRRRLDSPKYLEQYGYKVFSQNDEDGIIAEIFERIGTTNKKFIEFGVENGLECNTHYLLFKNWTGLWIEGSSSSFSELTKKFTGPIQSRRLRAINEFITVENINDLFTQNGFEGEIDLLSIDLDGNDYHIFEAISSINPRVIITEYNGKFPPDCNWIMPYKPDYIWDKTDRHGATLKAFEELGNKKNYQLVGTNCNGVNAFFVRKDLTGDLFPSPATAENLYNPLDMHVIHQTNHFSKECLLDK